MHGDPGLFFVIADLDEMITMSERTQVTYGSILEIIENAFVMRTLCISLDEFCIALLCLLCEILLLIGPPKTHGHTLFHGSIDLFCVFADLLEDIFS